MKKYHPKSHLRIILRITKKLIPHSLAGDQIKGREKPAKVVSLD